MATSHSDSNQGNRVGVPFQQLILDHTLLDREHLVSWSIIMVENPFGPKFSPFSTDSLT